MTAKPTRYFWIVLLALVTACGNNSQAAEMTKVQNTAVAIVQTGVVLTQTAMPTATSTNTPTALPTATTTPTLIPTFSSPPILTPDAIQVERWREYQTELAKALSLNIPCEWDILGQSDKELYVWAQCISGYELYSVGKPSVVYLEQDGSIKKCTLPKKRIAVNLQPMIFIYSQEMYKRNYAFTIFLALSLNVAQDMEEMATQHQE